MSIAIYDLSGNRILSDYEQLAAGDRTVSFNTSNFQAGVYILRVSAPDETITQKIVIVK